MRKGENIFKRKDGRWEARYIKGYELSGKAKYGFCYGKTYKQAKEKVTLCKAQLLNGFAAPAAGKNRHFAYYCDEWLRTRKQIVRESTLVKYDTVVAKHIKPKLGGLLPLALTTAVIDDFSNKLLFEDRLSPKSVRDILVVLNGIIKHITTCFPSLKAVENNVNDAIIVWLMLLVIAAVLLAIKAAEFFKNFNRETRYIKSEKRRAVDYGEYRYWRRELRCHYLCLLPFVNEGNVLKLYNLFYHRNGARKKENNSSVLCIIAPSLIGIFILVVCICGASWAWFTATTANDTAKIKTAQYTVEVSAKTGENDADVTDDGGVFKAAVLRGNKYAVTITPNGTAENGYCIVEFENKKYYTEQLSNGSTIEFSAKAGINGNITIQPMWGTRAVRNDDNTLKNEMDLTPTQNSLSAGVGTKNNDDKTVQHSKSTDKSVTESTAQSSQSSAKKTENEKQKAQSEINSADTFAKAVKNKSEESLTSSTAVVSQ